MTNEKMTMECPSASITASVKRKKFEDHVTGEKIETTVKSPKIDKLQGTYKIELFDEAGNPTQTIESDNAINYMFANSTNHALLYKLGLTDRHNHNNYTFNIANEQDITRIFDYGHIFLTKEDQDENLKGAIPTNHATAVATLSGAYSGSLPEHGSVNEAMITVETGLNEALITYVFDFPLEKGNGEFNTVWLGYSNAGRDDGNRERMKYMNAGEFKRIAMMSPTLEKSSEYFDQRSMAYDVLWERGLSNINFFPLSKTEFWGHRHDANLDKYYYYKISTTTNDIVCKAIPTPITDLSTDKEYVGSCVWNKKPAILKRLPKATNIYEVLSFDLAKESESYSLTNATSHLLRTEMLPQHNDLRLIHVVTFDDCVYAFFKPNLRGNECDIYIVKYQASTLNYLHHMTYTGHQYWIGEKNADLQRNFDIHRLNNIDYVVFGENNANPNDCEPRWMEFKTTSSKLSRESGNRCVGGVRATIPRQLEPNDVLFFDNCNQSNDAYRLLYLQVPFSQTKLPKSVVKDASKTMRVTYQLTVKFNLLNQFLSDDVNAVEAFSLLEETNETQPQEINLLTRFFNLLKR